MSVTDATVERPVEDWSQYEVPEEPALDPEKDVERILAADDTTKAQALATYRAKVDALIPTNPASVKSCGLFVEQCKLAAKRVEDDRTRLVKPLNDQVDAVNGVYMPVRDAFKAMAKAVTERVNKFIDDQRRAAEFEQQRLNKLAAVKQAELDRQADAARRAAEEAAEAGDLKAALKLESKATQLEQKAAEVVPQQAALPSNKVEGDEATVSFNGPKKVWNLPGWDKKKPLPLSSPMLASLVGDVSKLSPGLQFVIQHADLNPVRLNATYKGGTKFPAPFAEVNDYSGSSVRS